jgi:hypothetical protein
MMPPRLDHDDIDVRFSFHTAKGRPDVAERHDYIRRLCRELAHELLDQLPAGRDQALALTALEEVMMRGNRAIAIGFRDASTARPAPVGASRPVPRPPSAYGASRPDPRPTAYRGAVPKPRPAGDDQAASS